MRKLNAKQQKFVDAVSKGVGHKDAAIAAGYSPKSARALASQLLNIPKLKTALEERQEYYRSISNVEAGEIIGAYKEMAMASIEDALDDRGCLDFAKAKANGSVKLIKKISRQQTQYGETVAVEFYPRTDALSQLSDILGIKQLPRENAETIARVLSSFNLWLEHNPHANMDQKIDAIRDFASFGKIDEIELGKLTGIEIQQIAVTQ